MTLSRRSLLGGGWPAFSWALVGVGVLNAVIGHVPAIRAALSPLLCAPGQHLQAVLWYTGDTSGPVHVWRCAAVGANPDLSTDHYIPFIVIMIGCYVISWVVASCLLRVWHAARRIYARSDDHAGGRVGNNVVEAALGDPTGGMLTSERVRNMAFSQPPIGKRGYNEDEVDAFLEIVEEALRDPPGRALTPDQVRNVAFSKPPRGMVGYNEDEVHAFLDVVEQEMNRRATGT